MHAFTFCVAAACVRETVLLLDDKRRNEIKGRSDTCLFTTSSAQIFIATTSIFRMLFLLY
uniref:Uncharacterized protein n=1 Tax=Picea sitchensis TaxID=3332 RepID=B8LMQ6_PICSI|nr:unknown [Picea sitchensis]